MAKGAVRSADDVLAEQLQDPTFRALWERYAPARALANALVRYRADHDLSQTRLARLLGVSQPAVAKWETGEHNPTWETLLLIAGKLGISFLLEAGPAQSEPVWLPRQVPSGASVETIMSPASDTRACIVTVMPGPSGRPNESG
jgi:transcriptional regulator with XRE-family HTH domain